jgi:hypothetical protein
VKERYYAVEETFHLYGGRKGGGGGGKEREGGKEERGVREG